MPAKVPLRSDYDATALRQIAKTCGDARQVRRLLSIAAVYDCQSEFKFDPQSARKFDPLIGWFGRGLARVKIV